ncbi:MAG: PLP-dependent aspartate aminotransferase family protein [Oscillospiraceae bacterium]|jgi:cystathionine gamma-synthase|nr:PLP-dependent aspartate aminotransferase family protein [Oscillospiraceae bacterium]
MKFDSLCVHGAKKDADGLGSVAVPIYQTATFSRSAVGQGSGYDYSRLQNPTREQLELRIAALDGGSDAMAFSSGMAAAQLLLELFSPGDHIVISDDLYGGTHRLFGAVSKKNGLEFSEIGAAEELTAALRPNTKAVIVETPTNPMMKIFDIAAIASVTKPRGILLVVDNTFLTPYFQRPLELGADVVLYSGTKYLAGHNDTLAGFLVTGTQELSDKLRYLFKTVGSCLAPFDSFLVLRGLKTLHLRLARQDESAKKAAAFLGTHPSVAKVLYPGVGGMISFYVKNEETARRTLERLKLILFAESLGGTESLITYPMTQTHADVAPEARAKLGINAELLRLSVGVEDADDIIADLDAALSLR